MIVQSGFRENAEHFTNAFGADYIPADKKPVQQEPPLEEQSVGDSGWGSGGALDTPTQFPTTTMLPTPPRQSVQPSVPTQTQPYPEPVKALPFDDDSYAYLDKKHREGIDEIQRAIDNIADEIIPGVHPKLLESYSQLLERRTSAVNAYQAFLKSKRSTEIEERKMRVAEKKAGLLKKDDGGQQQNQSGLSMTPQQLVEFVRELDRSRLTEIPEADEVEEREAGTGVPDRGFE